MSQTKPNFLCIGAQKAGTTWLYNILRHHPDIWMPPMKEIHYFDYLHLKQIDWPRKRMQQLQTALGQFIKGKFDYQKLEFLAKMAVTEKFDDDYYLSLFKNADRKIIADITPDYSALNNQGFAHISQLLPEAKIIFIMRNPIKRAWSQAVMQRRKDIANNKNISHQEWIQVLNNSRNYRLSNYIETVELCKNHFARENRLFLIYDDICAQPLETIEKICNFLEIDYKENIFADYVNQKFNASPKYKIPVQVESFLQQKLEIQSSFVQKTFAPASFKM